MPPLVYIPLNLIGFFYKPSKIIFLSIITIFVFGLIFHTFDTYDNQLITWSKIMGKLANDIYFSGLTFLTIGYPATPANSIESIHIIKKIFVIFEAGIGILLSSSLLISFMNKYLSLGKDHR